MCNQGFIGSRCQADDPCTVTRRPCGANGACFPIVQTQTIAGQQSESISYHCQCYSGFYGQNCEFGKNLYLNLMYIFKYIRNYYLSLAPALPCTSSPCLNGGNCVNRNNTVDYYCKFLIKKNIESFLKIFIKIY